MLDARFLRSVPYSCLVGWDDDNHAHALEVFLSSARRMVDQPYKTRLLGVDGKAMANSAEEALRLTQLTPRAARRFFETQFSPLSYDFPWVSCEV